MKLAPAEAKAIKFVLFVIALAVVARWLNRPAGVHVEQSMVPSATRAPTAGASSNPRAAARVDPNTAARAELEDLPGIGQATAQKIIEQRPYETLDDLARVIGRKRASNLAKRVTLPPGLPAGSDARADASEPAREREPERPGAPINLNSATQAEVETLPGIGPSMARRLIHVRDSLRGFRDWSQVDSVKGIGPALLKKLRVAATL
jgi:DNA uptake protein ComE-like DNA-binding protein